MIEEKVQDKKDWQAAVHTDDIAEIIFEHTDINRLAVLSPEEMAETEGALIPLGLALGAFARGNYSAWDNHIEHRKNNNGQWASSQDTAKAALRGMAGIDTLRFLGFGRQYPCTGDCVTRSINNTPRYPNHGVQPYGLIQTRNYPSTGARQNTNWQHINSSNAWRNSTSRWFR